MVGGVRFLKHQVAGLSRRSNRPQELDSAMAKLDYMDGIAGYFQHG